MTNDQFIRSANLMIAFAITIEALADQMRQDNRTERAWWEAIDLLRHAGGSLRGAASQFNQLV